jgi:hypothetical protein
MRLAMPLCLSGRALLPVFFFAASGLLALDRQVIQNFDDQEDGLPPAGWTVGAQGGALGDWQVEAGELSIEGIGGGTGGGGREVWIWYDRAFSGDITIEFKITWVVPPAPDVGRHGGIAFFSKFPGVRGSRYAGMSGYTVDWIDRAADHGVRCHKWTNGLESGLLPDGLFTEPEPPERWRIEIHGDTISIFLDDQPFQDIQDSTFRDGYIGFWQWENNIHVHYDDFVVTNPDLVVNRDVPDELVNGTSSTVKLSVLPYRAGSVVVKEDLPAGLVPSSASNNGTINGRAVEWNLGNISDTVELTYTLAAGAGAVDADLGGSATFNGLAFAITGDTRYTGSPVTALGFIKLWNHLGPLAFSAPAVANDHGPPGACDANGGVDLTVDWISNSDGSINEANILPFPGMVTRPLYGGNGLPNGTGARAAGLVVEAGDTGAVRQDRFPVWKAGLTRSDTIDHASPQVHGFDAEDHLTMSCVYITNTTGAAIDTQLGLGSDDSIQILLNEVDVTAGGILLCRSWGLENEEQDVIPVSLPAGESRLLVKVTDGCCGSGFRLRFQNPADPAGPGLLPPDILFSTVSATSLPPATALRSVANDGRVSLAIAAKQPSSVVVKEVLPESASASEISDGGVLGGGVIRWDLSGVSDKTVTYKLAAPPCAAVAAFGQSTWAIGPVEALIGGQSTVTRAPLADQGDLASWKSVDIGYTGGAAQALGEHDVVVDAGGGGIKLREDQFRFIYLPLKGDFELTARMDCMSDSGVLGQGGLMVRDTLDVFSAHAYLSLSTGDLIKTDLRTIKGSFRRVTDPNRGALGIPIPQDQQSVDSIGAGAFWLKLARTGTAAPPQKISFYRSSDGVNYGAPLAEKEVGTGNTQISLKDDVLVGLAVTGGGGRLGVTFRGVSGPSFTESSQPKFHRGDTDNNGQLQLTDAVRILGFLFLGGTAPTCLDAADTDDNGQLQLTDAVRILGFLFLGQASPAPPGPPPNACGPDAGAQLGCVDYTRC